MWVEIRGEDSHWGEEVERRGGQRRCREVRWRKGVERWGRKRWGRVERNKFGMWWRQWDGRR